MGNKSKLESEQIPDLMVQCLETDPSFAKCDLQTRNSLEALIRSFSYCSLHEEDILQILSMGDKLNSLSVNCSGLKDKRLKAAKEKV